MTEAPATFETLARFDLLDAESRRRALTDRESRELERVQDALIHGRRAPGLNIELARRGMLKQRRRGYR